MGTVHETTRAAGVFPDGCISQTIDILMPDCKKRQTTDAHGRDGHDTEVQIAHLSLIILHWPLVFVKTVGLPGHGASTEAEPAPVSDRFQRDGSRNEPDYKSR